MLSDLYKFIIDILFPTKCISCKKSGNYICDDCMPPYTRRDIEERDNIDACFDYRNPVVKKAIWDLKYYNKKYASEVLGLQMYEYLKEDISELRTLHNGESIFVVPVPLSRQRLLERGYNQAECLASAFVNSSPDIFTLQKDLIIKKIHTGPQARINNKNKRLRNIRGAFRLKDGVDIKNKIIFVIDDVTTTGGTLSEIIKILKKAGARKVRGIAVAH